MGVQWMVGWMPHGMCFAWNPLVLWLRGPADAVIFLSYMVIPSAMKRVRTAQDRGHVAGLAPLFRAFILLCGFTHLMDVVTLWTPIYFVDAGVRVACALASLGTALLLALAVRR